MLPEIDEWQLNPKTEQRDPEDAWARLDGERSAPGRTDRPTGWSAFTGAPASRTHPAPSPTFAYSLNCTPCGMATLPEWFTVTV